MLKESNRETKKKREGILFYNLEIQVTLSIYDMFRTFSYDFVVFCIDWLNGNTIQTYSQKG